MQYEYVVRNVDNTILNDFFYHLTITLKNNEKTSLVKRTLRKSAIKIIIVCNL